MKAKKNNFRLLTFSVFFHLLACFCSVYFDCRKPEWSLGEINYWWYFLCWWSVQASLITIVYFIYRLFKKSPPNYFDKVFDLIVINANITSIVLFSLGILPFCWGGKPWIAAPSKGEMEVFSLITIDRRIFWWFYAIIWHYLAPILTITYFVRRKISLAKTYYERRWLFLYSFLHPFLYIVFVFYRPLIAGSKKYQCGKWEYPYIFFKWVADYGKSSNLSWGLLFIFFIFFALNLVWFTTLLFWWHLHHKIKPEVTKFKPRLTKKTINKEHMTTIAKKKKKAIIYLISGILIIIVISAVAYLVWPKNKSAENNKEPTNSKQQIQQLKTELNSLKSKLNNLSDTTQKTQLENKLSNLENQINNLSQPNTTLKKLEQDIKQIQQELGKKPDKPNPPTDPNQLQFTVYYFVSLGQNHMWIERGSDKSILIDKGNSIFPNSELTKKGSCYTITFSSQDAEKYHNQDHVFYFSKNNHKFSLVPVSTSPPNNPNNKKESKFEYRTELNEGKRKYYIFENVFPNIPKEEWRIIHISQDHSQIKELVSQGKLEKNKLFTIRYEKEDEKSRGGLVITFNESNQELEITEA